MIRYLASALFRVGGSMIRLSLKMHDPYLAVLRQQAINMENRRAIEQEWTATSADEQRAIAAAYRLRVGP